MKISLVYIPTSLRATQDARLSSREETLLGHGRMLNSLYILLFVCISSIFAYPALNLDLSKRSLNAGTDLHYIDDGIYVGNQYAAGDVDELIRLYNISAILNVAWDLDIRYPEPEYVGDISDNNEHLKIQYVKVGLVDAKGNKMSTLAAAVLALDQLKTHRELLAKDAKTYTAQAQNVLVHCHSGQSRSVTIATLYLFFKHRDRFPTYEDALKFVKKQRNLTENKDVPREEITELALKLSTYDLFGAFGDFQN
eukprot:Phypoly_transcript_14305.p1 GENE.Phypoly_transcript_14305~~Phypoly_transcript_14305.p1  ORF type:complete len:253 (+),score=22.32 Phypoly_transcript_14305:1-759(+)